MRTAYRLTLPILLLLALAACGGGGGGGDVAEAGKNGDKSEPEAVVPVEVTAVARGDIYAAYTGSASRKATWSNVATSSPGSTATGCDWSSSSRARTLRGCSRSTTAASN